MDGTLSNPFLSKIFHITFWPFFKINSVSTSDAYNGLEGVKAEESRAKIWSLRTSSSLMGVTCNYFLLSSPDDFN